MKYKEVAAVGLPTLVLTAGCGEDTCEITCADGYKVDWKYGCDDGLTAELAKDHGGSCTAEEH